MVGGWRGIGAVEPPIRPRCYRCCRWRGSRRWEGGCLLRAEAGCIAGCIVDVLDSVDALGTGSRPDTSDFLLHLPYRAACFPQLQPCYSPSLDVVVFRHCPSFHKLRSSLDSTFHLPGSSRLHLVSACYTRLEQFHTSSATMEMDAIQGSH